MGRRGRAGGAGRSRGKAARMFLGFVASFLAGILPVRGQTTGDGPWQASPWRSFPSLEWERHRDMPPWQGLPVAFVREEARRPPVEVLGFLPYWTLGTAVVPLDRITTLAYFAVPVNGDGSLGSARDWASATLMPLVTEARGAGVRVVLAVTCFDGNQMAALLSSAANRRRAVEGIVNLVIEGGGEGVNVDFEGLPVAQKAAFVTFVQELKAAMDQALGHASQVTVDTPAVDWSGAYDYDQLALAGDGLVIMGYDYHYRGGDPGPVAPSRPSDFWGKYSLEWTLDDYDRYGGAGNRGRFLLALPLYGYDWPATSVERGARKTGNGTARFYADCQQRAQEAGGFAWDADSDTPWFAETSGGIRQTWCEDLRSLTAKVGIVARRGIGGLAYWALGYEESLADPWLAIDAAWPGPPDPDAGGTPGGDDASGEGEGIPEDPRQDLPEEGATDLIRWPDGLRPWRDVPGALEEAGDPRDQDPSERDPGTGGDPGAGDPADLRETGFGERETTPCRCGGCQGAGGPAESPGWPWMALLAALWALSRAVRRRRPLPGTPGNPPG